MFATNNRRRTTVGPMEIARIARLRLERLETRALPAVTIAVNAALDQHAINPLIYGTAFATTAQLIDLNSPYNRSGGNAETDIQLAAQRHQPRSDWYFESIAGNRQRPERRRRPVHFQHQGRRGRSRRLTVPTIGWVAKLGPNRSSSAAYPQGVYPEPDRLDPYWSSTDPNRPGNGKTSSGPITSNDPNIASHAVVAGDRAGLDSAPGFHVRHFQRRRRPLLHARQRAEHLVFDPPRRPPERAEHVGDRATTSSTTPR